MIGFVTGARTLYHRVGKKTRRDHNSAHKLSKCGKVRINFTFVDAQEEELTKFAWSRWSRTLERCRQCWSSG